MRRTPFPGTFVLSSPPPRVWAPPHQPQRGCQPAAGGQRKLTGISPGRSSAPMYANRPLRPGLRERPGYPPCGDRQCSSSVMNSNYPPRRGGMPVSERRSAATVIGRSTRAGSPAGPPTTGLGPGNGASRCGARSRPGPGSAAPDPPGMLELVISRLADGPVPGAGMLGAIRSKRPAICSFPCSNRAAAAACCASLGSGAALTGAWACSAHASSTARTSSHAARARPSGPLASAPERPLRRS